jgi:hypothetical protein
MLSYERDRDRHIDRALRGVTASSGTAGGAVGGCATVMLGDRLPWPQCDLASLQGGLVGVPRYRVWTAADYAGSGQNASPIALGDSYTR